jgi:hypothetical protein
MRCGVMRPWVWGALFDFRFPCFLQSNTDAVHVVAMVGVLTFQILEMGLRDGKTGEDEGS